MMFHRSRAPALRGPRSGLVAVSFALYLLTCSIYAGPRHVYLTWQGDTSHTITVNYQTLEPTETTTVYYDTKPRGAVVTDYQFHASGTRHKIDGLADGRTIHWVELRELEPGTTYYFTAGDATNGFTPDRKFQTIP